MFTQLSVMEGSSSKLEVKTRLSISLEVRQDTRLGLYRRVS